MGHDFPPTLLARLALRIAEHCRSAQPVTPVAGRPLQAAVVAAPPTTTEAAPETSGPDMPA
jgi:hypothetical protein